MARKRLIELDLAKGFAIFLVVVGHIIAGGAPEGNEWFRELHKVIYRFHMPLFMVLSGIIFAYTTKPIEKISDYLIFVRKKGARLLPGFFIFGLIILAGKSLLSSTIEVANVPPSLSSELINILLYPYDSAAGSLWYIYVLFEFYLITPVLLKVLKGNLIVNLVFAFALNLLRINYDVTHLFMLNMVCQYYFYFSLGFVILAHYEAAINYFRKNEFLFYILFALSFISRSFLEGEYNQIVISLFSVPAIIAFTNSGFINRLFEKPLIVLSDYTFTIYLMNTITMGLAKGIMFKFFSWDGINFLIYLPVLLFIGTVIPIYIHKYIFTKVPYLNRITK